MAAHDRWWQLSWHYSIMKIEAFYFISARICHSYISDTGFSFLRFLFEVFVFVTNCWFIKYQMCVYKFTRKWNIFFINFLTWLFKGLIGIFKAQAHWKKKNIDDVNFYLRFLDLFLLNQMIEVQMATTHFFSGSIEKKNSKNKMHGQLIKNYSFMLNFSFGLHWFGFPAEF